MSCFSCIFFFFLLTFLKIYLRFLAYLSLLYLVKLKEKCHATLPFNVILSLSPSHRQASWKSYPHSLLSFLTTSSSSTMASQQRLIWGWQWSPCCCIKWLPLHSHWTWHLTSLGLLTPPSPCCRFLCVPLKIKLFRYFLFFLTLAVSFLCHLWPLLLKLFPKYWSLSGFCLLPYPLLTQQLSTGKLTYSHGL